MPRVIAHGNVTQIQGEGTNGERLRIEQGGHTAILSLFRNGERKAWLLTGWENEEGGAGVNPAAAYAPASSGISRQEGASPRIKALNAHLVNPEAVSKIVDAQGKPLRVYRGEWGDPAANSFAATRLGLPTFTDAQTIAEEYAADGESGRVTPAFLAIKNPLRFGMEDGVVTKKEMARIAKALRLTSPEVNDLVSAGGWVVDGQPESFQTIAEIPEGAYVEAPTLADTAMFQEKARAAGFDGIIIRGIFTSNSEPSGSFDGVTAIEYRPFTADQVRPAFGRDSGDAPGGSPARIGTRPGTSGTGGQDGPLGTPAERLSPETPVRIVNARPAPSLRGKDAEAWGRQNLLNRDFIKDGNTYRINQRGLEKMVRDATKPLPRVQVAAIYSLPELFDASIHVDVRPSDRSDPKVMAIHSFVAPLRWEGQVYRVRFLAKEQKPFAKPDKLHSYRVDEIQVETENPPVTTSAPSSAEPADTIPLRLLAPSVNLGTPLGTPAEPAPSDDAAIRDHLDGLRMESGLDSARLERDYQKALAEAPGRKTIGDPRLANPGRSDATRSVVNSVDEQRRNSMERESHDLWQAARLTYSIRLSQSQPTAFLRRAAVVIRMLVCPASIFWRVRMLRSAISANFSWVIFRAIRSRRKFAPNARIC